MARKGTRRIFRPGALRGLSAILKRSVKQKTETIKRGEKIRQAADSAQAILRKREEEKEAEAEFERRLASDPTRLLALKGLRRVKKVDLENIVENANENNETEENEEKERLREERRQRAKAVIVTAKKARATKKRNQTLRRGERKFGLEPINTNEIYQTLYNKLIANGTDPAKAEKDARFYANAKAEPLFRALTEQKAAWGDLLLEAEPVQKPSVKPSIATSIAIEESVAPLRSRTYASIAAIPRKADYRQLALTNLPNVTSATKHIFDIKDMKRQVYGKMAGKEIFPELTKATTPIEHIYVSAKTDIRGVLRVSAFVTYRSHAYAKRALDYHRAHPIMFKHYVDGKANMEPAIIDQARKEDEKASFRL